MSNIIVFHGTDIVRSRQAFIDKIAQFSSQTTETIRVEGKQIDDNFIQTNLYSPPMFQDSRLIAIENLFSLPKSDAKDQTIKQLAQVTDCPIIIWEGKEIETKSYPKALLFQIYKLPNELFTFLDQIDPANLKGSLVMLERIKDLVDENYLFIMLARQIRLLILVKGNETADLAPWQVGKLKKQAEKFSEAQLFGLYRGLRDLDYNQKTSQSIGSYFNEIEFLISNF